MVFGRGLAVFYFLLFVLLLNYTLPFVRADVREFPLLWAGTSRLASTGVLLGPTQRGGTPRSAGAGRRGEPRGASAFDARGTMAACRRAAATASSSPSSGRIRS